MERIGDVDYRPAIAGDLSKITGLFNAAVRAGEIALTSREADDRYYRERAFDDPPRYSTIVAVGAGTVVGCACISRLYRRAAYDVTGELCIVVAPEWRRRGVGGRLLEEAAKHARGYDLANLLILAVREPRWTTAWLARKNFEKVGELPALQLADGRGLNVEIMQANPEELT